MRLLFFTNRDFEVTGVVTDSQGIVEAGGHLLQLFEGIASANAASFLAQLSELGLALSIPLAVVGQGVAQTLRFSGCLQDDSILIAAAVQDRTVLELLGHLDDPRARLLRSLLAPLAAVDPAETHRLYGELTQLNNDLSTIHRELALKKRELENANGILQQQAAELSRLNVEKNRFIGIASHDLRSPIGNIIVYAEIMLEEHQLDEEPRSMTEDILQLSQGMASMVNEILDVAAIESGTFTLNLTTLDLAEAVARSVSLHRHLAERKHIDLQLETTDQPLLIAADSGKLGQVLNNLLSNAVKFSYPGSSIEVAVRNDDGEASVSVRDHGVGILEDEQSRLFTPFEKLSARSTAGEPNTGLGLSIVRKIVEAHQGTISVTSKPGEGSTFTVRLPHST